MKLNNKSNLIKYLTIFLVIILSIIIIYNLYLHIFYIKEGLSLIPEPHIFELDNPEHEREREREDEDERERERERERGGDISVSDPDNGKWMTKEIMPGDAAIHTANLWGDGWDGEDMPWEAADAMLGNHTLGNSFILLKVGKSWMSSKHNVESVLANDPAGANLFEESKIPEDSILTGYHKMDNGLYTIHGWKLQAMDRSTQPWGKGFEFNKFFFNSIIHNRGETESALGGEEWINGRRMWDIGFPSIHHDRQNAVSTLRLVWLHDIGQDYGWHKDYTKFFVYSAGNPDVYLGVNNHGGWVGRRVSRNELLKKENRDIHLFEMAIINYDTGERIPNTITNLRKETKPIIHDQWNALPVSGPIKNSRRNAEAQIVKSCKKILGYN